MRIAPILLITAAFTISCKEKGTEPGDGGSDGGSDGGTGDGGSGDGGSGDGGTGDGGTGDGGTGDGGTDPDCWVDSPSGSCYICDPPTEPTATSVEFYNACTDVDYVVFDNSARIPESTWKEGDPLPEID